VTWRRRVLLATLLALAGCNGLAGAGTDTGPESITPVSPAVTERGGTPTTDSRYPPGLAADGFTDPQTLARAHADALDERGYTLWHTRTTTFANGTVLENRTIRGTFGAGQRYRAEIEHRGLNATGERERIVAYSDGQRTTRQVIVTQAGDRRLLRNRSAADIPAEPLSVVEFEPDFRTRLGRALAAVENASVETQFPNTLDSTGRSYRIEGDLAANSTSFPGTWNGSVSATVAPDGIVRVYSLSYTTTRYGQRVRVTERGGYVNLDA